MGLCKRRNELVALQAGAIHHRHVLADYPAPMLDLMIGAVTASALVTYTLYTVSEEIRTRVAMPGLLLTVPLVLYGLFRYLYLVYRREEGGDPTQSLFQDPPTIINLALWVATVGYFLYAAH
jgi:hypothetical protein